MKQIDASEFVFLASKILDSGYPQISRNKILCDILSILEDNGVEISQELAKAAVNGDDETALMLLDEIDLDRDISETE